jgi:translocator protein
MSLIFKTIISILVIMALGFASGMVTAKAIPGWYAGLEKPSFNPPNWLFGPAWALLYSCMGIAFARIWHSYQENSIYKTAIFLFAAQLILNVLWTLVFFGMKQTGLALAEIVLLWALILACILQFKKIDMPAALLFVPYWLWVSFATLLNFMIWKLN